MNQIEWYLSCVFSEMAVPMIMIIILMVIVVIAKIFIIKVHCHQCHGHYRIPSIVYNIYGKQRNYDYPHHHHGNRQQCNYH